MVLSMASGENEAKENGTPHITSDAESQEDEVFSGGVSRQLSQNSICATEDEEDCDKSIDLGPQCTIKEQLEKDKDDESLRRWKEQLLGSVDVEGEKVDPEVKFLSLAILTDAKPEGIVLSIPENGNPKGTWFTLKEGSRYRLSFTFVVKNNIVSGLKYTQTIYRSSIKVNRMKGMLGTFAPQKDHHKHTLPEQVTPSGMFSRGKYIGKCKFMDDDKRCHLEIEYSFEISKDWGK